MVFKRLAYYFFLKQYDSRTWYIFAGSGKGIYYFVKVSRVFPALLLLSLIVKDILHYFNCLSLNRGMFMLFLPSSNMFVCLQKQIYSNEGPVNIFLSRRSVRGYVSF